MNLKQFGAVFAAAALCLAALAGCTQEKPQASDMGGDLLAAIQAKGEIVVAMEGTWAPWTYHDESGELVGYDVEVARRVAEKLDVAVNFVEGEFNGLLAGLEDGRYDIIVNGVGIDENRREKYDFSVPYAYDRTAVIVRADDDSIQAMEDLDGKQTANTLYSTYAAVAEQYGAQVTGVDDFIQTIELLATGRIDATLNAEVSYNDYMAQHPDAPIKVACMVPEATQVAIPMRKGEETAALREAIDQALTELAEEGVLTELSLRYFGMDLTENGQE